MKFLRVLSSALALRLAEAYLVAPPGPAAPGASSQCSAWVESSYGLSCEIVMRFYGLSLAQFIEWVRTETCPSQPSFFHLLFSRLLIFGAEPDCGRELQHDRRALLLRPDQLSNADAAHADANLDADNFHSDLNRGGSHQHANAHATWHG